MKIKFNEIQKRNPKTWKNLLYLGIALFAALIVGYFLFIGGLI